MEPLTAAQKETDAALRAWRQGVARDLKQPAFCVFADRVLRSIVVDDPQTPAELLEISGLGRAKVERWGDAILHAMRNGEPSTSLAKTAPAPKAKPVREKPVVVAPAKSTAPPSPMLPPEAPASIAVQMDRALKVWRMREAKRLGIAPFVLLLDQTIRGIVAAEPGTPEALHRVDGLSSKWVAEHGDAVIDVLAAVLPHLAARAE